jgi:hypothetical protein
VAQPSDLDQWLELLTVGPFGGLDPTTNPYFVAPTNFVDGENFVPNHGYGGFVTVMGRNVALATPLPGPCRGMHVFHRQGLPDIYLFAVDVDVDPAPQLGVGALYWAPLGGIAQPLALPQDITLTGGQQTFFADCSQWVFITNGVDRPLKIDINLLVTYWGILAPTAAPVPSIAGPGPLLGTYYYAFTWGNDVQESSQGVISAPVTCAQATASSDALQLSGKPKAGDVVNIFVGQLGMTEYGASYTVPDPPPNLQTLAQSVAQNFNVNPFVTQYAFAGAPTQASAPNGQILLTAANPGDLGNTTYVYASVDLASGATSGTGGGLDLTPHVQTLLSGGADGNTVLVTIPKHAVFPGGTPPFTPDDPQVTELNLYRLGGSLGTWNLITTFDATQKLPATYYDATPDSAVTGQQLVIFRDAPPPFKYIATHMERIFGFNIPVEYNPTPQYDIMADPSVAWWSNLNEPWGFNSEVNNFTCGDNHFSDVGVGLMELGGVLMAVKSRRCYFIYGSTDADFQPIFAWFVGCDAPLSIATGYGVGFWHSRQGVHMTDGNTKQQISDSGFAQSNVKNILDMLTDADFAQAVGFMYDRQYYLSLPTHDITLLFDMRDQQWYKLGFSCAQVSYDLESDVPVVALDNKVPGQIDKWFDSPCDFDGVVTARLKSRTTDGGIKHGTKRLERGLILAPIQPGVCAKVILTGDPDCITQVTAPQQVDLGDGFQRHEWGIADSAAGNLDCDTFNVTLCVDGPAIIDAVSVYGWVVRVHAMGGPRTDFESVPQ